MGYVFTERRRSVVSSINNIRDHRPPPCPSSGHCPVSTVTYVETSPVVSLIEVISQTSRGSSDHKTFSLNVPSSFLPSSLSDVFDARSSLGRLSFRSFLIIISWKELC
ncbi:unnamed protein product [Lactuca saligna]|uniref:Uncharacterized protein n=1 Tax=Lactuca saligna TaxID=75948 RepID=A0AA35YNC8_LACSI|nr:unnamed protein product [Lactuca saligna]